MSQANQLWDLQFFRKYVPTLIVQLQNVETSFEMMVVSLSQLHHRLSSILVQQPPRFAMMMAQKLFDRVRSFTQHLYNENKMEMIRLSEMLKEFKGCMFDLSQYYQDHQEKTKEAEQKVQKISDQIQKFIKHKQQMQENTIKHECKYYRTQQPYLNFQLQQQKNKNKYLESKLDSLTKQAKQSKICLENCCIEQNLVIRNCLERINTCADRIMNYPYKENNFQTFNRKNSYTQMNPNQANKQGSSESRVKEFRNSDEINKIVEQTESNCQFDAYAKIKQRKSLKVLEAAVLAESKDEIEYRSDLQKASEAQKYKRKTYN